MTAVPTRELAYLTGQTVALEAAAGGAAVAFTATEALSEYLNAGFAAPVAVGDPEGWRHTVDRLLRHPAEREALAEAGRAVVTERFTYHRMWRALRDELHDHGIRSGRGAN
ncbi:glycosyltransferase family 1 protein [Kocuria sp. KD4]|nr:glycosyltransferase family 1 protein [Kocuria sp. KD4]